MIPSFIVTLLLIAPFLLAAFALGYWKGFMRGIDIAAKDALTMAGVINDPIDEALEPYVRRAVEREQARASKPKVLSVKEEWEAERERLHDAGIF